MSGKSILRVPFPRLRTSVGVILDSSQQHSPFAIVSRHKLLHISNKYLDGKTVRCQDFVVIVLVATPHDTLRSTMSLYLGE